MDVGATDAGPSYVDDYIVCILDRWNWTIFKFDAVRFFENEGEVLLRLLTLTCQFVSEKDAYTFSDMVALIDGLDERGCEYR